MKPNTLAMCCHLASLTGYLGNGIGFVLGPLVVWILKRDEVPEVDEHGKEALNFNVSIFIYTFALVIFSFLTFGIGAFIAVPLIIAMVFMQVICTVIAAIKANNGESYRYPLTLRLIH